MRRGLSRDRLRAWRPHVVLNATAFSARRDDSSPLEAAGAPVLQARARRVGARGLGGSRSRGLSPTDLAMHVVLPELDGRLLTTAISFKAEAAPLHGLEFARTRARSRPPTASRSPPTARRGLGQTRGDAAAVAA